MALDPRTEFHRVIIRSQPNMVLKAFSTGGQRSSRVASLCEANGLVVLPPLAKADGKKRMEVGESVEAMIIGEIEMI
jgi:gephyrin